MNKETAGLPPEAGVQAGQARGRIIKATGGFYYVDDGSVTYTCRARGLFRKNGESPLVGDWVTLELTVDGEGYITQILPRKNQLLRPPLANLDRLVLVSSTCDPPPNFLILDKLMAIACHKDIQPVLAVTKGDLAAADMLETIYRPLGIPVFAVGEDGSGSQLETLRALLSNGVSAFSGNTGVGKSSLLNRLDSRFCVQTGQTSKKLGRGRHTTRHVELYPFMDGHIADTPGFSAVEMERCERIEKEDLADCFIEFAPYLSKCRFTGCSHTVEKGCAVLEALEKGQIHPSRHESYCQMYGEARKYKAWE